MFDQNNLFDIYCQGICDVSHDFNKQEGHQPSGNAPCVGIVPKTRGNATMLSVKTAKAGAGEGMGCNRASARAVKVGFGKKNTKVRSISHWSPYDPVGVVNADP